MRMGKSWVYKPSCETLDLLERLSEPVDGEAFEAGTPASKKEPIPRGFVAKTIDALESGDTGDEDDEEDDEIVRVTKKAAAAAAVRKAAAKISRSSSHHSAEELEKLPSRETPTPTPDGTEDNPDASILTDALTTAEMDN